MTVAIAIWAALGIATLVLAVYRRFLLVPSENDVLHLGAGEEKEIPGQALLAQKMDNIDRWGKTMTVITIVIGLALAAAYFYQVMENPNLYRGN
jgi:hypothetical protein